MDRITKMNNVGGYLRGVMLGSLLLAGCKVGPNYSRSATTMPSGYREIPTTQPAQSLVLDGRTGSEALWWRHFNDPQMVSLVERAIRSNYNITVAQARLMQSRAQRQIAQSLLYPTIGASASIMRMRAGKDALPIPIEANFIQAGFDAAWTVDVFGGIRRQIESSRAMEEATESFRHGVVLMVAAETARDYVELRGYQHQLKLARQILEEQNQTYKLTEDRFNKGLASHLELVRARTEMESAAADIPPLEQAIRQYVHAISILLAQQPTALDDELLAPKPIPEVPAQILVGVPSDLLRRRPDIQSAERLLASATSQVGVATSSLLPQVVLGGTAGLGGTTKRDLLDLKNTGFYAAGPSVNWTLFDAGRRRAVIKSSEAEVNAAKATYENTVLQAFAEVEDGIVGVDRSRARVHDLRQLAASARECVTIARQDYEKGILDQLTVLDAQRQVNRADMLLVQSEVTVAVNVVALYKALGGGWQAADNTPATQPATLPYSAK